MKMPLADFRLLHYLRPVFTRLHLRNFKNLQDATLTLGPLSIIAGANAAGKSNLRDAFRFLHGIGRGYSVAEIIGEKWSAGGVMEWAGMRGGLREVMYEGAEAFCLEARTQHKVQFGTVTFAREYEHGIHVAIHQGQRPRVIDESLWHISRDARGASTFERSSADRDHLKIALPRFGAPGRFPPSRVYINSTPMLAHLVDDATVDKRVRDRCQAVMTEYGSCRFLDLSPAAMRLPSIPGQLVLGDRGDNLSSVLQAVCAEDDKKAALLDWVRQLTPMDAADFEFPADQTGRVLLTLVESNGRRISAYSASDGTLRLLAILAALLGPAPARFYFLEELENGIHPNRLSLLVQLLEAITAQRRTQIIATTHSPQLLRLLSRTSLECASLVYRLAGTPAGRIKRIVDIPDIQRVLETQDLARLHESGWLEDVLNFSEAPEPHEEELAS